MTKVQWAAWCWFEKLPEYTKRPFCIRLYRADIYARIDKTMALSA